LVYKKPSRAFYPWDKDRLFGLNLDIGALGLILWLTLLWILIGWVRSFIGWNWGRIIFQKASTIPLQPGQKGLI